MSAGGFALQTEIFGASESFATDKKVSNFKKSHRGLFLKVR